MAASIESVVYQHAENACALWWQRTLAVREPHYNFRDLVELDDRLEANLDGLRIAGDDAVPMLGELLAADDPGAVFVLALFALEHGNREALDAYIDRAKQHQACFQEVGSALAWIDPRRLKTLVKDFLDSSDPTAIRLGLLSCAAHGRSPGRLLWKHAGAAEGAVRCAALRAAADTAEQAFLGPARAHRASDDTERFEAARALALLGDKAMATEQLKSLAARPTVHSRGATDLLMMLSSSRSGRAFLKELHNDATRLGDVISAFGKLGDPVAIKWLIKTASSTAQARAAGAAISMITGVDLDEADLTLRDAPADAPEQPTDDPADDDVSLDADENLPWPDVDALERWWDESQAFQRGVLYLSGKEKSTRTFAHVLAEGPQWQRHAAALQLAIGVPAMCYVDVGLPSHRQKALMETMYARSP